jgi:hypothetical protein
MSEYQQLVGVLVAVVAVLLVSFMLFLSRSRAAGPNPPVHVVVDLDETLIHRVDDPGAGQSAGLNVQSKYWDRVIFRVFVTEPGAETKFVYFTLPPWTAYFFRSFHLAGASFGIRSFNSKLLADEVVKIVKYFVPGVDFREPACQRRIKAIEDFSVPDGRKLIVVDDKIEVWDPVPRFFVHLSVPERWTKATSAGRDFNRDPLSPKPTPLSTDEDLACTVAAIAKSQGSRAALSPAYQELIDDIEEKIPLDLVFLTFEFVGDDFGWSNSTLQANQLDWALVHAWAKVRLKEHNRHGDPPALEKCRMCGVWRLDIARDARLPNSPVVPRGEALVVIPPIPVGRIDVPDRISCAGRIWYTTS